MGRAARTLRRRGTESRAVPARPAPGPSRVARTADRDRPALPDDHHALHERVRRAVIGVPPRLVEAVDVAAVRRDSRGAWLGGAVERDGGADRIRVRPAHGTAHGARDAVALES